MKRSLILTSCLSILALTGLKTPANAAPIAVVNPSYLTSMTNEVQPFHLVYLGYQGFLQKEGIPSSGGFVSAYQNGKITAKNLIDAAIAQGKLSPEKANDRAYIRAVEHHLMYLDND
jgi:hypothetical protein